MTEPVLAIEDLAVTHGTIRAVEGASLTVAAGEIVALVGDNGSGKSSLLNAVIGLIPATVGTIRLNGELLAGLAPVERARRGIGYVPEGRRVFPGMTAEENLLVASRDDAARRSARASEMYGLFPQLAARRHAPAWQLSGGEQQMLAVARALMGRPRLLLVDEPTLGLAPAVAAAVTATLRDIARSGGAILLAEQDRRAAQAAADRILPMRMGRIG